MFYICNLSFLRHLKNTSFSINYLFKKVALSHLKITIMLLKPFALGTLLVLTIASCKTQEEKLLTKALKIHKQAHTIDSHVDTPMWLMREGFNFGERNDKDAIRSKLDLPRMEEGGLDGVFFAAFVGQGERTAEGFSAAFDEAGSIIDSIYSMVGKFSEKLEIACSPADLKKIENEGKKAIFLGMENGFPIGNNLDLIDTFYNRGIRYITLCHSLNNDICDSSTDTAEYHGISDFGKKVIERMNDLGIMIDISHASDESFYQAIELSRAPVIASHSCAKALCDNPRNLTDEMLLKLKANRGVIQMCILSRYVKEQESYPERDSAKTAVSLKHGDYYSLDGRAKEAFLVDWFQVDTDYPPVLATVSDVVDHIDHIVEVAGIEHVGIGTDFDGGGGVADCFDVSQMGNITKELVRRGYSSRDIKKIWGGNLMRVMEEVNRSAS